MKQGGKAHKVKKHHILWVTLCIATSVGLLLVNMGGKKSSYADVVNIAATVPTNIVGSTPTVGSVTLNCSKVNWESMTPVNDTTPLVGGEYKVDISASSTFSSLVESSGYITGTSYTVVASLTADQTYYYRLRARDPARPAQESQYSATKTCQTVSATPTPTPTPAWVGSQSSYASQTPPASPTSPSTSPSTSPPTPTPPPVTEGNALNWLKTIIVDPFIGHGAIDLTVETKPTSTVPNLNLPKNSQQLIYVRPKNMPKEPAALPENGTQSASNATALPPHVKPGIVGMRPADNNFDNILISYLDEKTHVWEFIPTYINKAQKTLDFRAIGVGTYTMTKITDAGNPFKDIKPNDWFQSFAENARMMKIGNGDGKGNFMGGSELTRGEAYGMIAKAFGRILPAKYLQRDYRGPMSRAEAIEVLLASIGFTTPATRVSLPFSDVPKISRIYPFLAQAFELDIIKGYDDSTFRPFATITRAEMAKIIIKAIEMRYLLKTIAGSDMNAFLHKEEFNNVISMHRILGGIFTITR